MGLAGDDLVGEQFPRDQAERGAAVGERDMQARDTGHRPKHRFASAGMGLRPAATDSSGRTGWPASTATVSSSKPSTTDAVRYYWRDMLKAIGLGAGQRIGSYTIQAYFVTALISAGFPTSLALLASMLTYAVGPVPSIWGGILVDRHGARVPLLVGYGLFVLLTVPTFTAYVLSFPPEVRSSAAALNFNIGTSLIGSTAGLIAVWLHGMTGTDVAFGWYMTSACVVSILVTVFALPPSVDYREPDWNEAAVPTRAG